MPRSAAKFSSNVDCFDYLFLSPREGQLQSRPAVRRDRMKRLDAAKLERLGRLVCGPLWQSELARTLGVSRQTILRWAAGEFDPSPEHTAKAKKLVRARIGELQRLLKVL
jgi:DNA-binding XRE family transcriptional regulator